MTKKEYIVIGLALLQILSFSVFLKGFFPLKQGLKGFARLEDSPAVPGDTDNSVPSGHYDRLIIVVIDALRADFVLASQTYMPFLKEMIRDGHVLPFIAKAHPPTVTLPRIKVLNVHNTILENTVLHSMHFSNANQHQCSILCLPFSNPWYLL